MQKRRIRCLGIICASLAVGYIWLYMDHYWPFIRTDFLGNIAIEEDKPLYYIKDTLSPTDIFTHDDGYYYLRVENDDTLSFRICFEDFFRDVDIHSVGEHYQSGMLYRGEGGRKTFRLSYYDEPRLAEEYFCAQIDHISIENGLYSFDLAPPCDILEEIKDIREPSVRSLMVALVNIGITLFVPYKHYSSPFPGLFKYRLEKTGTLIYSNKRYPGIELAYNKWGFNNETKHIIQYPIILLPRSQNHLGPLIWRNDEESLHSLKKESYRKHYSMVRYDRGFLRCLYDDSKYMDDLSESLLDSLIYQSNRFIYSYILGEATNGR